MWAADYFYGRALVRLPVKLAFLCMRVEAALRRVPASHVHARWYRHFHQVYGLPKLSCHLRWPELPDLDEKPVIFCSLHFGRHEAVAAALWKLGRPCHGLVGGRTPNQRWDLLQLTNVESLDPWSRARLLRRLLEGLQNGTSAWLFLDVADQPRHRGLNPAVPFLAERSGAALVPVAAIEDGPGTCRVRMGQPTRSLDHCLAVMEDWVRQHPHELPLWLAQQPFHRVHPTL